jgi:hypothetical protein
MRKEIKEILILVWDNEDIPHEWKEGIICPLCKEGDQKECGIYRGTSVLNAAYKIFFKFMLSDISVCGKKSLGHINLDSAKESNIDQISTPGQIFKNVELYLFRIYSNTGQ